jgi:phospholipase C
VTFAPVALDTSGQHREPVTSTTVRAVCGDLTVTFDVHYVDGPAGDRAAARQADAIYALLECVNGQVVVPAGGQLKVPTPRG